MIAFRHRPLAGTDARARAVTVVRYTPVHREHRRSALLEETVTVSGEEPSRLASKSLAAQKPAPSQNVINVQRRAAGVLPMRVDVPRAGVSHQFVKPLVVDQETVVSLTYKRR